MPRISPTQQGRYRNQQTHQSTGLNLMCLPGLLCAVLLASTQVNADLVSDDFCTGTLDSAWTPVDPQGDGTLAFSGATTADAWLEISVPSGPEHQLWTSGIQAPHIIQSSADGDFEIEVKFESPVNAPQYQEQGVLVKQDDYNFLRFEIYSTTNDTNGIAAALYSANNSFPLSSTIYNNGSIEPLDTAPIYMRISREGDLWTQSHSTDGVEFTNIGLPFSHELIVTGVGVYGANGAGSSSPAHTAKIDYFENLASPITNEDVCAAANVTVTYDGNGNDGGSAPVDAGSPYVAGSTVTVLGSGDLSLTGHSFSGWNTQTDGLGTAYAPGATFTINASTTLYAQWAIDGPGFRSDDFCTGTLDESIWTWVDPQSDGTLGFSGAMTTDAWLEISVPAGPEHQLWTSGIQAPHVIQSAADTDFELEVKFESPVNAPQYQEQGVLIKQDDTNFLRFEIYSSNSATFGLAATLPGGNIPINQSIGGLNTAPIYMRVKRQGNLWTQSYSTDGSNFTTIGNPFNYALTVEGVGIYGGNGVNTTSPAHTAQFDYFQNLADPIVDEDACTPCNSTRTLVQNDWQLVSLACDPVAGDTVAEIFGDDLGTGTYNVDWIVYHRNETAVPPAYVSMQTTDALTTGMGYWIKTLQAGKSVAMDGISNTLTDIPLTCMATAPGDGCGNSAGQCNMVGNPHNFDVCWGDVQVIDETNPSSPLTLDEADPGGVCQTDGPGCIMSSIAHKWTGANYATINASTPGMQGTLKPWDGFWVSANKPGIKLRIPATSGSCDTSARTVGAARGTRAAALAGAAKIAKAPGDQGWYIRLIAESGHMRDATNVFGLLPGSVQGYDAHDLQELEPFSTPYLTVVFPHEDWGPNSGDYASDYRKLGSRQRAEIWPFEVRASGPERVVTLSWEASDSEKRLRNSTLIDLETGQNVGVSPGGSYTFKMTGESYRFRWIQNQR